MTFFYAILLGLLQGITEFLPISSSGHLVILESFMHLDVESLKDFDVMLHLGTLIAILIFFWKDIWQIKRWPILILASVPAIIIGLLFEDQIDAIFRNQISVAIIMIIVGALFLIPQKNTKNQINYLRGFLIGCAQAVAIIPGVSRSGSTIFTGTMLGITREESARFSFLLGSIAIAGAGFLTAVDLDTAQLLPTPILLAGFLASFLSSIFAVSFLMNFLKKHSLKAFGIYRIIFGLFVLGLSLVNI
ncbi:MAG: undecaprenyl-diphosphate phosphatase [Candidatus Gracilibacteria bacterium]